MAVQEHETKYVFRDRAALLVRQSLEACCRPDPVHPTGTVTSIYFDTRSWALLDEKVNSDFFKSKVRLRSYADLDGGRPGQTSFLELKVKEGACREKQRFEVDLSGETLESLDLSGARLPALLDSVLGGRHGIPGRLFPAFKVSYKRHRYIEPLSGLRVALDHGISVPAVNPRMIRMKRPIRLDVAVCEVKGAARDLPRSLRCLATLGCRKEAFSKYQACFERLDR